MKLKQYDVVKRKCGFWGNRMHDVNYENNKDELFIIEGSYSDLYGGASGAEDDFKIVSLEDGNSSAWWVERNLEFIRHGTKEEFEEALKTRDQIRERESNLEWIKDNFDMRLSTTSILKLFQEIDYDCGFDRSGEFYAIGIAWDNLFPIFDCIIRNRDIEAAVKECKRIFKQEYQEEYIQKFRALYNKIHNME